MELLEALGINLKILFAQLVNFAVLLFVLWRFAYKPILNVLKERREKVSQGIQDAKAAELKLNEAKDKEKAVIIEAKKEAQNIIDEATERAEKKKQAILDKAKEEVGQVINAEKKKIQQEKADTLKSIKADISSLVVLAVERVMKEKVDSATDKKIIKEAIKDLK
ncbi:MAG: F0F1 ATP synthase subunit B [Parcubacteria group bacterium]